MAHMEGIIVLLLGAVIGSFFNVCIYRLPRKESVAYKPSHCPGCGSKLGVADLVPVLSYLFLRGRCRHQGCEISPRYPLVEIITALLFLAAYINWGVSWHTASMWVFLAMLVLVSVIDIYHRIIPDEALLAATIIGLPLLFLASLDYLISGVIGFFAAGLLLLVIAAVSRGGMGGGDVKLSAVMGLFLGWQGVAVALFLSFLAGGVISILLLATKIKGRKDAVPFGPYLALGGIIAAFYAERIIAWYMGLSGL
ncbi:MAG: prepilin peptidase [Firmicutes bacterium]|nr:prepilin peptidase [Bacillota bacterium]